MFAKSQKQPTQIFSILFFNSQEPKTVCIINIFWSRVQTQVVFKQDFLLIIEQDKNQNNNILYNLETIFLAFTNYTCSQSRFKNSISSVLLSDHQFEQTYNIVNYTQMQKKYVNYIVYFKIIDMQRDDENQILLQLQQRRIELEQENQQLRTQLSRLGRDLVFNIHKEEVKEQNPDNGSGKEQIKYTLTHSSTRVLERQAEITFLDQPKRLILQVQSSCQEKGKLKEFYIFSYSILLDNELEENPKIMATDSKIEIIFDKNQKNNFQLIQQSQ